MTAELAILRCPSCGTPVKDGQTKCPSCNAELVVIPRFENSKLPFEQDMSRLLLEEKDVKGFFDCLEACLNQTFGYNLKRDPLNTNYAAMVTYMERVVQWAESHEEEIDKINREDAEKVYWNPVLGSLKFRLREGRRIYEQTLNIGWPQYIKDNLQEFPAELRNDIFSAVDEWLASDNKSTSGEVKAALLAPSDKVIKAVFQTEAVLTIKRLSDENKAQHAKKIQEADVQKQQQAKTFWGRFKAFIRGS
jgi:hypothetical protein